jgi:hypothetical protein
MIVISRIEIAIKIVTLVFGLAYFGMLAKVILRLRRNAPGEERPAKSAPGFPFWN